MRPQTCREARAALDARPHRMILTYVTKYEGHETMKKGTTICVYLLCYFLISTVLLGHPRRPCPGE